ncbi:MAG: TraY domain-containing protein [Gammaproteobacteria bacterium]|nr:TraY domain-containing protein [Gammaproteobacteria bacterium]MBT3490509.1 TraY domain-containing protein [Gammaproteobacteria bacterium]MBT3717533.1 TraY domain-containing protein [Gammaproteobacteria bacterium]MBT3845231.1 TraY domain-containing protein [Gammaproteobacteria bacterium]MBT3892067.1 TraY domain-containing protein [Gammaproteobacteria bacterium]
MLSLRLPETIETRLTTLARTTGRTKSFYAKEAILKHIDELEERYLPDQSPTSPMDKGEHDRWFKKQVEQGLIEADKSDAKWFSEAEVAEQLDQHIHAASK